MWDCLKLVDLGFLHLDLLSGDIKLETLWFFSIDLDLDGVFPGFGHKVVDLVSKSYSKTFVPHIWSLLSY